MKNIKIPEMSGKELIKVFYDHLGGTPGTLMINDKLVTHFILHQYRGDKIIHTFDWYENETEHHSVKVYVPMEAA